jgi:opine dehydrogenase
MGYPVRLYDIVEETVQAINEQGGVHVSGVVEGFGKPELVTTDIAKAIDGADAVMVVAPAVAHRAIAKACAPHLQDGQVVILHPGATCGALEFRNVLDQEGSTANVTLAETNSLIYACRAPKPGHVSIKGIKQDLVIAAFPASEIQRVHAMFSEPFPQVQAGKNIMSTSLSNPNAIMHPAPTLLNTSLIESRHSWLYYWEGVTPSIGKFVEKLDQERLELCKTLGVSLPSIKEWYQLAYGVDAPTLSETVRMNPAYAEISGQKELRTRYLLEDLPTGLVPMVELGQMLGLAMSRMKLVIELGQQLLEENFYTNGRTLKNLGLEGMTPAAFQTYLETGAK